VVEVVEAEEVLEAVALVVVALEEGASVEAPQRSEWADLGQVERHLAELVLRE
jgi:hypothetical protein